MNLKLIILILGILSIALQFFAAYFGYRIWKFHRMSNGWIFLIIAFLIQGARRIFTTLEDYGISIFMSSVLIDRTLMFIISLFIALALWSMMKRFENFDVVEKETKRKVAKFK